MARDSSEASQLRGDGKEKSPLQSVEAAAQVFEPAGAFEEALALLGESVEQIESLGAVAMGALAPMKKFHEQVAKIAESYGPMKAFQDQLAALARNFEPMKGLHEQLSGVGQAFHDHLTELAQALDPIEQLRAKVAELAGQLKSASELQEQFRELARVFQAGDRPVANGADRSAARSPSA